MILSGSAAARQLKCVAPNVRATPRRAYKGREQCIAVAIQLWGLGVRVPSPPSDAPVDRLVRRVRAEVAGLHRVREVARQRRMQVANLPQGGFDALRDQQAGALGLRSDSA